MENLIKEDHQPVILQVKVQMQAVWPQNLNSQLLQVSFLFTVKFLQRKVWDPRGLRGWGGNGVDFKWNQ